MTEEKKIFIDEDWKSQVEAEKAAVEAARQPASQPPEAASAGKPETKQAAAATLPPADFSMLVTMLATQAMVSLGALPNPLTHQVEADVPQARHFIDLLEMLEEKTKGNLKPEEARLLDSVLHELRMAFVATK